MMTRRRFVAGALAGAGLIQCEGRPGEGVPAGDAGEFRRAFGRLRLPYPHPRRPGELPYFLRARVHAGDGDPEEMAELHKALRLQRVVIVTPSVYGTDNSTTLFGMKARGKDARGVAVIDDKVPESELDALGRAARARRAPQSRDRRHQRSGGGAPALSRRPPSA